MSLVIPSSSVVPLHFSQYKVFNYSHEKLACYSFTPFQQRMVPCCKSRLKSATYRNEPNILHKYAARSKEPDHEAFTEGATLDLDDEDDVEDTGSPWEGAVIYKRNPSISHLEYCTTLERLGLGKLSTDVSKNRASVMGLRVTKAVKDYPHGTPVQISIDVIRKKKKLRLDGIIKAVITLPCNRCGMPAAECIFSEFCLLLTEEPIDEPETIDLGVIYGEDKFSNSVDVSEDDDDDHNDALIDLDDRLHFPHEQKTIDISKHIRDRVHIEITINALCVPGCKGLCLKCGQNLNISNCNCSEQEVTEKRIGPLGNLKEKLKL